MTEKELQARKRLAKKLTALRKTLRKDERDILDRIVVGTGAEVSGHSMLETADASEIFQLDEGNYAAVLMGELA